MLHRCLSLRYVPGDHHVSWCCSLDPPSPRNPLTGCFFIAKLVKHIVQLSHRYFFFFLLLLLSLRCSFVFIASIYLFGASCQQFSAFSLQAATGRWGGMMPFYFPGVQQTTVNNVCCVLQHSRSRQASYSSRDVRCSYPYFLLPLPFPLD